MYLIESTDGHVSTAAQFVLCLSNENYSAELTIGKVYKARDFTMNIMTDGHDVELMDDRGIMDGYHCEMFMPVDEFNDYLFYFHRGTSCEPVTGFEVIQMFGEWKEFHDPDDLLAVTSLKIDEKHETKNPVLLFERAS